MIDKEQPFLIIIDELEDYVHGSTYNWWKFTSQQTDSIADTGPRRSYLKVPIGTTPSTFVFVRFGSRTVRGHYQFVCNLEDYTEKTA